MSVAAAAMPAAVLVMNPLIVERRLAPVRRPVPLDRGVMSAVSFLLKGSSDVRRAVRRCGPARWMRGMRRRIRCLPPGEAMVLRCATIVQPFAETPCAVIWNLM